MIKFFRIGTIVTSHGIKGEVKVQSSTSDVKRYDSLKKVYLTKDSNFQDGDFDLTLLVEYVKYVKKGPILKFRGYDSIEDSAMLIGYNLYVDRDDAIRLHDNEYYLADLVGLTCYLGDEKIGDVKDVMITKANGVLVISHKKDILVPFVYDFVESIDFTKNEIHLKTLEGLL